MVIGGREQAEHGVEAVVADHMGDGMKQMLAKLGIELRLGAAGAAPEAVKTAYSPR